MLLDLRTMLEGFTFLMRSSCQWNQSPKEFGPKSAVHDYFLHWNPNGVIEKS